jgi:hypothetical protein
MDRKWVAHSSYLLRRRCGSKADPTQPLGAANLGVS